MFKRTNTVKLTPGAYSLHNRVKLIKGGREYFDLLENMIVAAKLSIHFQVYIFEEDETGNRVADALISAAARGVKVYLLVDGYASKNLSRDFTMKLESAGINFRRFEPILKSRSFYFGRRLHHKVIVTDVFHGLVGGLNITDRYNDVGDTQAWLDWALYVEGGVADALARICIRIFKQRILIREDSLDDTRIRIRTTEIDCGVRARTNDWVGRKREITNSYLEMFRTARSNIIIMSPYFLPGKLIRRRIRDAVKRGVRIRVIQAGISDIAISKFAERYMYRWLFKHGIEIFEYQKTVLHGKMAISDDRWMTVGSYNLNNLSAYASVELNLDVDSPSFVKGAALQLEEIIKRDCVQITEEKYVKGTHLIEHLLQKAAYNLLRMTLFLFTFYFKQKE